MNAKDIVSRDLIKRIALDIARILFGLKVDSADLIETQYQRLEDRRADLVARMQGEEGDFILHAEIQNGNDRTMPWRMLRYRAEIGSQYPDSDIRQYLIYIGRPALGMAASIQQDGLDYRYRIIDMHAIDCQSLLAQDNPDALVMAILCDFKGRPEREVVHFILQRLQALSQDNETRFREYLAMLEILSTNRDLKEIVQEEQKMLSQVKYSDLPSYTLGLEAGVIQGMERGMERGMEQGMEQGIQQGESKVLQRQLTRRFGPLPAWCQERLEKAGAEELECWADRVLDATTLEAVFRA